MSIRPLWGTAFTRFHYLADWRHVDRLLQQGTAVLFKHSPNCRTSRDAYAEMVYFAQRWPSVPVYLISVQHERTLADYIAQSTGVRHASPQLIVWRHGQLLATTTHDHVTAQWLLEILQENLADH